MSKGQKNRRIGMGMKERNLQADSGEVENPEVVEASTTVGQETPENEAPDSQNAVLTTPEEQDEKGKVDEEKPLQILESPEKPEEPEIVAGSELMKALEESGEPSLPSWPTVCIHGNSVEKPCPKCEAIGRSPESDGLHISEMPGSIQIDREVVPLGPQPDGTTKIILTIPEGYWEAVKEWADSSGQGVEEWCNALFLQNLETWAAPAGKR